MTKPKKARAKRDRAVFPSTNDMTLDQAREAGLLNGDKVEHVSVEVPAALLEAARNMTGVQSLNELCILALATVALPDPVVAYMERNRGVLGEDHTLEY